MSSPAARAREKRTKTRGDAYCERPADVPSNSGLPHYGWLAQHALIMSYAIVLKAMWSLRPRELPRTREGKEQGALLNNASITQIAKATARYTNPLSDAIGDPMPRRTVGHCIAALRNKGFIEEWGIEDRAKTSPAGTSYRIRKYDEILQRWADDPNVGTVGKRAFYVIGKGRRLLTPAEVEAWHLNHAVAAQNPAAQAKAALDPDAAAEPAAPAAPAEPEPAAPLNLEPLMHALIDVSDRGDLRDAEFIWKEVVRTSGARPVPPVDAVAAGIRTMGANWRKVGQQAPLDHGLIKQRIGGYLEAWRKHHRDELAAEAKAARWERDARINSFAGFIRQLAQPDLPADDRERIAELLGAADPGELEEANRLFTRTA